MAENTSQLPRHYPPSIRFAHWLIVGLVTIQFLSGGGMAEAFEEGLESQATTPGVAILHAMTGLTILFAMIWRLAVRIRADVPPPPSNEPTPIQWISRGTHWAFYIVLVAMSIVGWMTLLTGSESLGRLHALSSWLLLALVLAHMAGAFWHITMGDGVLERVFSKSKKSRSGSLRSS